MLMTGSGQKRKRLGDTCKRISLRERDDEKIRTSYIYIYKGKNAKQLSSGY